jgi:CheY-like chemotaxis protein
MKKILIVDDQIEVRELVEVTLSMHGYQILHAEDGSRAFEIVKAEKPDLTIMDVMMPNGISGLEATRLIKTNDETKHCKVIMLTARGQEPDIEAGYAAGADDYFVKPFSPLQLIRKVEEFLA